MSTYRTSFMVTRYKDGHNWVLYNWLNTSNVIFDDPSHPFYTILENRIESFAPFEVNGDRSDFDYLVSEKFIVQDQDEVRAEVQRIYESIINRKEHLSLTLLPVGQECNFNCTYCAQKHDGTVRMGDKDVDILRRFIMKNPVKTLRIDYFGGEPLMNPEFIMKCNSMVRDISREVGFVFLGSSVTTNGYLLDIDLFKDLYSSKVINYQITLDGLPEIHDRMRPLSDGSGTFDRIYTNLLAISALDDSYDFSISLRINFNRSTLDPDHRSAFIDKLRPFLNDKRFKVMPQAIENWRRENRVDFYCGDDEKILFQHTLEDELESLGFYTVGTVLFADPGSHSCYCSKPNNFVVFPADEDTERMKIQKCTREIYTPENDVGYIDADGDIHFNSNLDIWVGHQPFEEEKCRNCFLVLHCFGNSCPYNNWEHGRKICTPIKNHELYYAKRIMGFIAKH